VVGKTILPSSFAPGGNLVEITSHHTKTISPQNSTERKGKVSRFLSGVETTEPAALENKKQKGKSSEEALAA
jgi:hypothetical protein